MGRGQAKLRRGDWMTARRPAGEHLPEVERKEGHQRNRVRREDRHEEAAVMMTQRTIGKFFVVTMWNWVSYHMIQGGKLPMHRVGAFRGREQGGPKAPRMLGGSGGRGAHHRPGPVRDWQGQSRLRQVAQAELLGLRHWALPEAVALITSDRDTWTLAWRKP